ncbi:hypothetical protein [Micromonospora sp. WMMD812]|uniref:hypothetical protein n=1 Tax=Micromonospora sp. WMMD812 TaxID=3015152 RepID=UPI00248B7761|nr:hypothetical protein [Micromonospora sp. WMMD812]WBB68311.1 hypothetical protein O7603_02715 [Micromonospora sp. WMMD812]
MNDDALAASLTAHLSRLTFVDRSTRDVTTLLVEAVAAWGEAHGFRVYRRAASVVPLPAPYQDRHSVVDVAFARPAGRPIVVEVDHTDRRRTVEKLLAEADAGRVALWVRWGPGPFAAPPAPIHLVTCEVAVRNHRHSRLPARAAPQHSAPAGATAEPVELPLDTD